MVPSILTAAPMARHNARLRRLSTHVGGAATPALPPQRLRGSGCSASATALRGGSGAMEPTDIMMGGIWFGPFSDSEPDMSSSPNADATIHAALEAGVRDYDSERAAAPQRSGLLCCSDL